MNKLFATVIFLCAVLSSMAQPSIEVFSPSTFEEFPNVRDLAITPDGNEMYFTVQSVRQDFSAIMVAKKSKKGWGKPEVASFSGQYKDIEPFLSEDGLILYFASSRPVKGREGEAPNYDIWKTERKSLGAEWSLPVNLGAPINTEADEFYASVANSGNLYFTAQREGSKGKEDIFLSRFEGGKYQEPESLPESINSKGYEFNAFVSYDENYIIFTGYGREDGLGDGDLYVSQKNEAGEWQPAVHFDLPVNSKGLDYCPYIHNNKLYFTSNRSDLKTAYDQPLNAQELLKEINKTENGKSRLYFLNTENWLPGR